jgi:hypothetical protein
LPLIDIVKREYLVENLDEYIYVEFSALDFALDKTPERFNTESVFPATFKIKKTLPMCE